MITTKSRIWKNARNDRIMSALVLLAMVAVVLPALMLPELDRNGLNRNQLETTAEWIDLGPFLPAGGQGMAPGPAPDYKEPALLVLPLMFKTDQGGKRTLLGDQKNGKRHYSLIDGRSTQPLLATTSQISARLGRQFTLVGAKPSGTG